jgi:sterol desaturase/sphingolipid hydroxylase (fatty acid hydroxylase superfamily)
MTLSQGMIVLTFAGLFLLFLLLETVYPLRGYKRAFGYRLAINLCLAACAFVVAAVLVKPVALSLVTWTSNRAFGLLHLIPLPAIVRFALGFLLMDLTFYYWHRANHQLPYLWRFHNVHHIDPDLDVSTAFRFHVGEIVFSAGFRIVQIGLIGPSAFTYLVYEGMFQGNTLFHHSNVRLSLRAERLLNTILVTPRMHGIHHSVVEDESKSNYGTVVRWWDALHGSLRLNIPQSAIVIGVPVYLEPADNTLSHALTLPFRKQRHYWSWPDGTRPTRDATEVGGKRSRLVA